MVAPIATSTSHDAALLNSIDAQLADRMGDLEDQLAILRELVSDDIQELQQHIGVSNIAEGSLISSDFELVHVVRIGAPAGPQAWRARCGFKFGAAKLSMASSATHGNKCLTCLGLKQHSSSHTHPGQATDSEEDD